MSRSSSLERKLDIYPPPRYFKMIIAYAYNRIERKGESITNILKKHFDSLTEVEQKKLLDTYEKLTPEQKRHPGRLSDNSY